ncbi:MAG: S8 family serine peptidase [Butyrivibrio sp.]|nr:S8 family serine peptidase [Butyrivibrio sp.]
MKRALAALLGVTVALSSGGFSKSAMAADLTALSDVSEVAASDTAEAESGENKKEEVSSRKADRLSETGERSDEAVGDSLDGGSKEDLTRAGEKSEDGSTTGAEGTGRSEGTGKSEEKEEAEEAKEREVTEEISEETDKKAEAEEAEDAELSSEGENKEQELLSDKEAEAGKASDLPDGINKMPEGYELSEEQIEMKKDALSHDALSSMGDLTEGTDYVSDEVICLADSREEAEKVAYAYSGKLIEYSYGVATISLKDSALSVEDAFEYALDENLELPMVEPNYINEVEEPSESEENAELSSTGSDVPAGNGFSDRWWIDGYTDPYLNPESDMFQWHHSMINTYSAWGVTKGSKSVTVAVVDTGINASHTDLDGNISVKPEMISGQGYGDKVGHGTHVAGIIAGEQNGQFGAGVAPGVSIIPLKVKKDSEDTFEDAAIVKALDYAAGVSSNGSNGARKADIVNMSLGTKMYSATIKEAVDRAYEAGVTIVASMGNDVSNAVNYPAALDHVIAVAAVDHTGSRVFFSNYGSWADIAAPGTGIYSTYIDGNSSYYEMDGTSQASPMVAGACALYMSAVGHVDPDTMEKVLKKSTTGSAGSGTGAGIIDLAKMFGGDTTAPLITLKDAAGAVLGEVQDGKKKSVSESTSLSSTLSFTALNFDGATEANRNTAIVYTTDGSAPSVYDGNIVNGDKYEKAIKVSDIVGSIETKTKVTVKAAAVTGMGVMGKVSTLVFTVSPDASAAATDAVGNATKTSAVKLVESISVSGQVNVPVGSKASFKASVLPSSAKNKKVTWSLVNGKEDVTELDGVSIDKSKGQVTVDKTAAPGKKVTVKATAADESGRYGTATFTITSSKTTGVNIAVSGTAIDRINTVTTNKTGAVTALRLYSVNIPDSKNLTENQIKLSGSAVSGSDATDAALEWSSSNDKIAEVISVKGSVATIQGNKAGTATITCTAQDGSKKKAKVKVTVITPASDITLDIGKGMGDPAEGEFYALALGKSASVNATLGNTYGKATVTKKSWYYELGVIDTNSQNGYAYQSLPGSCQEDAKKNKMFYTVSNGKVKAKSYKQIAGDLNKLYKEYGLNYFDHYLPAIKVWAGTGDGTEYESNEMIFMTALNPTTSIKVYTWEYLKQKYVAYDRYYLYQNQTGTLVIGSNGSFPYLFSVESSNPNIVSAVAGGSGDAISLGDNKYGVPLYIYPNTQGKKGTARITITALDGSNKKTSISIQVR